MYTLGVSCFFHDSAAALLRDGELIAAAEEERFSRKKHDFEFPAHAISFCLRQAGITGKELDHVIFFEKPFLKFERILTTAVTEFPAARRVFQEAMLTWLKDKLWIKSLLIHHLQVSADRVMFSEHHLSHAASTFLAGPFEDAAILTVDGVGEWATATFGEGHGTDIRILGEISFPHSLGLLYSAFTAFLGFEVNEGEYKVMGMAPFGTPRYADKVRKLIRVSEDGSFELDMSYFSFHHSSTDTYNQKFIELFGTPRPPEMHFFTETTGFPSYFGERPADFCGQARVNQHYADIAASIQAVIEEVLILMARGVQRRTGLKNLCMAGGVALNSVANAKILCQAGFDELFIQPAAGDGGGALGAALWGWHSVLGNPRKFHMTHAYWGEEHSEGATVDYLRSVGTPFRVANSEDALLDATVDALARGAVVGWSQGRFEWGPRALGNRSILADPRRAEMKEIVNTKIKFREPFRPFAPSVLEGRAAGFFDDRVSRQEPTKFMLMVADVKPGAEAKIPAVTHVDGTGRLQTVSESSNPLYHGLISRFEQASGVPVVLNTSFNLRGEPIVNSPAEALSTFVRSDMDVLVLGNVIVEKVRDHGLRQ
jgi:carbamoyltransferase